MRPYPTSLAAHRRPGQTQDAAYCWHATLRCCPFVPPKQLPELSTTFTATLAKASGQSWSQMGENLAQVWSNCLEGGDEGAPLPSLRDTLTS